MDVDYIDFIKKDISEIRSILYSNRSVSVENKDKRVDILYSKIPLKNISVHNIEVVLLKKYTSYYDKDDVVYRVIKKTEFQLPSVNKAISFAKELISN